MKNRLSSSPILLFFLLLAASLAGCAGTPLKPLESLSSLSAGETVVVGRIELIPRLEEGEQRLDNGIINLHADRMKNAVYLLTGKESRTIDEPAISDYDGRIEAKLHETFYVRAQSAPLYINAAEIFMSIERYGTNKVRLPARFRIDIRPGDKAVYIGTVRFYRDEFFEITRVEVIDEYEKERSAFKKSFGAGIALKKAIVKRTMQKM